MKRLNFYHYISIVLIILVVGLGFSYFKYNYKLNEDLLTGYTVSSQVGNLSATVATYIACTWSNAALNVTFNGTLNPGDTDKNASRNFYEVFALDSNGPRHTSYNVTIDTLSNVAGNITIKGLDLISGSNAIGIGNVTWISNSTIGNATNMIPSNSIALATDYDTTNKVGSSVAVGSSVHYRFWIDIPSAQVAGNYIGNYTMQCAQAT